MKFISISILGASSAPIIFLLSPTNTAGEILAHLKVKEGYVLFSASDPSRVFAHKDELYSQVENGDQLYAAVLAAAAEAYRRSRAYH